MVLFQLLNVDAELLSLEDVAVGGALNIYIFTTPPRSVHLLVTILELLEQMGGV